MVFANEGIRALRETVVYLRTAISMSRNENAFKDLDSRIEKLGGYLQSLQETSEMAKHEQGVDEYVTALENMTVEVETMLEEAKKKKKKKGKTY